jgi:hypothetical protein
VDESLTGYLQKYQLRGKKFGLKVEMLRRDMAASSFSDLFNQIGIRKKLQNKLK